jgi:hypothetical protein
MSFRVEYKRPGGTAMFQRNVRFHVDITCATPPQESNTNGNIEKNGDKPTIYCITFTLISGKQIFYLKIQLYLWQINIYKLFR